MRFTVGLICTVCLFALCGCAPTLVGANQAGGMISNVRINGLGANTGDAFALANASCQKYGKVARMSGSISSQGNPNNTVSFDCVAP